MVSIHLKNISQIGHLPQIGVKIKNIWNHAPPSIKMNTGITLDLPSDFTLGEKKQIDVFCLFCDPVGISMPKRNDKLQRCSSSRSDIQDYSLTRTRKHDLQNKPTKVNMYKKHS